VNHCISSPKMSILRSRASAVRVRLGRGISVTLCEWPRPVTTNVGSVVTTTSVPNMSGIERAFLSFFDVEEAEELAVAGRLVEATLLFVNMAGGEKCMLSRERRLVCGEEVSLGALE